MRESLKPGLRTTLEYPVPQGRTVPELLPESEHFRVMPRVLATGYLVGLVEWACIQAITDHLDDGERTLGVHVDLSHEAPTPPGATVSIEVELVGVERAQLEFEVLARDEVAVICRGRHRRAVIDVARFERRVATRRGE